MPPPYYHVSDIHIRLFNRHEEYRTVFSRLWGFLDENPRGVVVVTGDVLHNKVELTPECIILCREFLTEACRRATSVVVIPGNHDALLNNRRRMDSLSAVLHGGMPDNLFYLKDTGVYEIDGDRFTTMSVLDPRWDDPSVVAEFFAEHSTDGGIALFHGGVGCYRLGNGSSTTSAIPLSCFQGYDAVMLGDIHRFQFIGPRCAYAGSLISQNFSETDDDHGVLVWLTPHATRLHRLENDHAHKCIRITAGASGYIVGEGTRCSDERECVDALLSMVPPKARVRVLVPPAIDKALFMNMLRRNNRIGWMIQDDGSTQSVAPTSPPLSVPADSLDDLGDTLRQYIGSVVDAGLIEDTTAEAIGAINRDRPEQRHKASWRILRVEWSNMFGYGEGNVIDLSRRPCGDIIGVFGPNSCGKSTIIDVITFILFGRITRWSHGMQTPPEVVRMTKQRANGCIVCEKGGSEFTIKKTMTRNKDGGIKVRQELHKDQRPIHLEDRRATDRLIREMFGTYDQFMFMSVMLQRLDRSALRDMTQKDRKEFFIQHLGLNVFDSLADSWATELANDVEPALSGLRTRLSMLDDSVSRISVWTPEHRAEMHNRLMSLREERARLVSEADGLVIPCPEDDTSELDVRIARLEKEMALRRNEVAVEEWRDDALLTAIDERLADIMDRMRPCAPFVCSRAEVVPGFPPCPCCATVLSDVPDELVREWEAAGEPVHEPVRTDLSYDGYVRSREIAGARLGPRIDWSEWAGWGDLCAEMRRLMKDLESLRSHLVEVKAVRLNPECPVCMSNPSVERAHALTNRIGSLESEISGLRDRNGFLGERMTEVMEAHSECARFVAKTPWTQMRDWMATVPEKRTSAQWSRLEAAVLSYTTLHNELIRTAESHTQLEHEWRTEMHRRFTACRENERAFWEHARACEEAMLTREDLEQTRIVRSEMLARKRAWERFRGHDAERRELEECYARRRDIESSRTARARRRQMSTMISRIDEHINEVVISCRMDEESVSTLRGVEAEIRTHRDRFSALQHRAAILRALTKQVFHRDGFPMFLLTRRLRAFEDALHNVTAEFIHDRRIHLTIEDGSVVMQVRSGDGVMDPFLGGMEGLIVDVAMKTIFSRMSRIPSSGLLIIDENVSVLDEDHIHNLDHLFRFLSSNYEHVMVMSHIPVVKDFVSLSVSVEKSSDGSCLCV